MKLLLIAAEPREYSGLLKLSAEPVSERPPRIADWSKRVRLGKHNLLLLANGAGPERAAAAVEAALGSGESFDAVVSTGFCGALDPALRPGEIFIASEIHAAGRTFPAARPDSARPHAAGRLVSISSIAATAAEKKQLRASGAAAVEMEAGGVAAAAEKHGLPVYCVRAVTDGADESFVLQLNSALRPDGHFATMQILRAALGKPLSAFPELWRLRGRCALAARNLGDFFVDCRF